ncbi:MAG: lytic transglycosylase domain-containing protein [Clostridium sp.]|nr:lytic transglycosylase domain-containing protein [Clostridium sp.]
MIKKMKTNIKILLVLIVSLIAVILIIEVAMTRMYPTRYKEYVFKYSNEYELDPYLVFSVIKAESSFNPDATSHMNARGLMQVTDETALWIAEMMGIKDFDPQSIYNPQVNIMFGCWFLSYLSRQFDSVDLVIASYNAGGTRVRSWLNDSRYSNSGKTLTVIPYGETAQYLKRVKNYYSVYKKLYA